MKSILDLSTIDIPYGVLHDQRLKQVRREGNKLIFTFDIEIYPQDYTDDFYKQYLDCKHCDMIIELEEEDYFNCDFNMITPVNRNGRFQGTEIPRESILDVINNIPIAAFNGCSSDGCRFIIELNTNFYKAKGKYKKYKKFCQATIELFTTRLEWKWY